MININIEYTERDIECIVNIEEDYYFIGEEPMDFEEDWMGLGLE